MLSPVGRRPRAGSKAASSALKFRLVQEAELPVIADVDHGLGLAGEERPLKNEPSNASSTASRWRPLPRSSAARTGVEEHVAFKGPPRLQDAGPHRRGQAPRCSSEG